VSENNAYGEFAAYYDRLMQDAPYDRWMTFFQQAMARYQKMPRHVADLGCGTGTLTVRLFAEGYKVTGVDLSEEMLIAAQDKVTAHSPRLRFLCQDLRELRLPELCDVAVSFCDAMSYLLSEADLKQTFERVRACLKPDGLFLFDLHSLYKLRETLGQQVFYDLGDDVSYVWQSRFDAATDTVEYDVTFFALEKEREGLYRRFREVHHQRAYEVEVVTELLRGAGFNTVEVYADFSWDVPTATAERLFFVAR